MQSCAASAYRYENELPFGACGVVILLSVFRHVMKMKVTDGSLILRWLTGDRQYSEVPADARCAARSQQTGGIITTPISGSTISERQDRILISRGHRLQQRMRKCEELGRKLLISYSCRRGVIEYASPPMAGVFDCGRYAPACDWQAQIRLIYCPR